MAKDKRDNEPDDAETDELTSTEPTPTAPSGSVGNAAPTEGTNDDTPPQASGPGTGEAPDGEVDASSEPAPARRGPATARTDRASDERLSDDEVAAALESLPVDIRNRFVSGTLTVHYSTRSVDFPADGDAAMRLLAVLAGTSRDMDDVVRDRSDARHCWMMVDRDHVVGAYWTPAAATVPRRVTMDPDGDLVDAR